MTVDVCENPNIIYYWLTKAEKENKALQKTLMEQRNLWKTKGYKVCTFISGEGNLVDLTKDLLIHNREVFAQKETECSTFNFTADV